MNTTLMQNHHSFLKLPVLALVAMLLGASSVSAATYYSRASGNWNTNTTWSLTSGGSAVGSGVYPVAGDTVIIERTYTVTNNIANAACASVQLGSTATTTSRGALTFSASGSPALTVSGNVAVGTNGNVGRTGTITFTSGSTLIAGSVALGGSGGTPAPGTITMTAGGTLSVGGAITVNTVSGNTWTPGTGTVILTANNTLPATILTNFDNLAVNGGTTTMGAALTVTNLTITSGTFNTSASGNYALTLSGNFTNNGTFTANGSPITLTGTGTQSIAGFTTTNTVSMTKTGGTATFTGNVNGGGLTINGSGGTLNLGTGLTHTFTGIWMSTAGTLNGGSSTLNLGDGLSGSGGTFIAGTGTVNYNGNGAQTVAAVTYSNLVFSGSGTKSITNASAKISGSLSIAPSGSATANVGTGLTVQVGSLDLGGALQVPGTWGSSSSLATHQNNTYFAGTGMLNVLTGASPDLMIVTLPGQTFTSGSGNSGTVVNPMAGTSFNITLTAVDTNNVIDTTYSGTKTISYSGPASSPSGYAPVYTTSVTFSGGQATGVAMTLNDAQTTTVTATDGSVTGVASSSLTVVAAPANKLAMKTEPSSSVTAGGTFSTPPAVFVEDIYGNVVTTDGSTVTATVQAGTGPLTGTLTAVASGGVATFSALAAPTLAQTGLKLTFTDGILASAVDTISITVTAGTASKLAMKTEPSSSVTAGGTFSTPPAVNVEDTYGNVVTTDGSTVTATLQAGTGPLTGTLTAVASSGVATFSALAAPTLAQTGLKLTFTDGSLVSAVDTTSITVNPAAPNKLVMATQPSATATAGVTFAQQPVIYVEDAYNNLCNTNLTVTATRSGGAGTLLGTTSVAAVAGVVSYANLAHPYATNITIQFTSGSLTAATSSTIAVSPNSYTQLVVLAPGQTNAPGTASGVGGTATAEVIDTAFAVQVLAADAYGNLISSVADTVSITSSDSAAVLPANAALVNGANSFTVTLKSLGSSTVTAKDTTTGTQTGTSSAITVTIGSFAKLQLLMPGETAAPNTPTGKTGTPTAQTAGTSYTVTVNAVDANWNVVSTNDTVAITSSDSNAALPANAALSAGSKTFTVTNRTVGIWTVTASDMTHSTVAANTSPSFTVNAGAFAKLQVLMPGETAVPGSGTGKTGTPAAQPAGSAVNVTVNAVDASWNAINTNDTVHLASSDANAVLAANANLVNGTQTLAVTLKTAGSQTVTVSDVTHSGVTANTGTATTINPSQFVALQVLMPGEAAAPGTASGKTGTATTQIAGSSFNVTVHSVDVYWNVINTNDTVHITSSDAQATLPANAALASGTGTFSLTNLTSGIQTVTASDVTRSGIASSTGTAITVNPAAASRLVMGTQPSATALVGVPFPQQPVILIEDNYNNVRSNDTLTVTAASSAGDGNLQGTTTMAAVGGVVTYTNLAYLYPTNITIQFTSGSLTPATSTTIAVSYVLYTTNGITFNYANRAALLADGWSFYATSTNGSPRNTETTNGASPPDVSYDQVGHPGVLRIPVNTGDLWAELNNTINSLFRDLSTNWASVRLDFTCDLSQAPNGAEQVNLVLYQDDDNYIEVGHGGGYRQFASMAIEDGGFQAWSPRVLNSVSVPSPNVQLRLDQDPATKNITGYYSLDGNNWVLLGGTSQALVNPRLCIWAGEGDGTNFLNCDLRQLTIVTSTPVPPALVAQPQHLVFNSIAGQACSTLQQLRVVALPTQSSLAWTATSTAAWLLASATSGGTPGSTDISVDTTGLAPGTYQGSLQLAAPGASSVAANVTLIINPASRVQVATWQGGKAGAMTVSVERLVCNSI